MNCVKSLIRRLERIYWNIIPYDYRPSTIWYNFACWGWRRYTTVKPRYLNHTWCDRTDILPHIMFEILSQFIEKECNPEIIDWEGSGHTVEVNGAKVNVRQEMQTLYDWWHKEYIIDYPKQLIDKWEEIKKYSPRHEVMPCDNTSNMLEGIEKIYSVNILFEDTVQEEMYYKLLQQLSDLEVEQEQKLIEMLHRLVSLQPYLWT